MVCLQCGQELLADANVCRNCGAPRDAGSAIRQVASQPERRAIIYDWSQLKRLEYFVDQSGAREQEEARTRVESEIVEYLQDGWVLDGPFDEAVELIYTE